MAEHTTTRPGTAADTGPAQARGLGRHRLGAADRVRPQDGLMRAVQLDMLRERQRHCARDWLTFLAQSAAKNVARRLRVPGPGAVPASAARRADCAFAPLIRVRAASGKEARS